LGRVKLARAVNAAILAIGDHAFPVVAAVAWKSVIVFDIVAALSGRF